MSSNPLSRDVKRVALAVSRRFSGPRGDEITDLISREDWVGLVNMTIDPRSYDNPEIYFRDVASLAILKKYESLPTGIDKAKAAVDNFWKAEATCYRTNQRLLPFIFGTYEPADEAVFTFIRECRKEVVSLIGSQAPSDPKGRFGPGSTYGDRGSLTTLPDKMQSRPHLTCEAVPFLQPWSKTLWAKACFARQDQYVFCPGNRFTTVPKDAKTDRGISIEPAINVFYQLAYGKAIKKRMKENTAGRLDLTTAQERHRQVARVASIDASYATIDLSQASDTVAWAFVKLMLPRRWFTPLDQLRSKRTILTKDGVSKSVLLEKFSSMGNGYTFELETLLFLAVSCAVMRRMGITPLPGVNVHVYGDDIIVPTSVSGELIAALKFFGMKTNEDKTFINGPFRESCGGDYFLGVDVRPYHQKKEINEPQHFIGLANGIRRMAFKDSRSHLRWHHLQSAWFSALDSIPSDIRRCRGPQDLGDICIHDDQPAWQTKWVDGTRYVRVYKPVNHREVKFAVFDPDVQLATACYGVSVTESGGIRPRDSVTGYATGWVSYS